MAKRWEGRSIIEERRFAKIDWPVLGLNVQEISGSLVVLAYSMMRDVSCWRIVEFHERDCEGATDRRSSIDLVKNRKGFLGF